MTGTGSTTASLPAMSRQARTGVRPGASTHPETATSKWRDAAITRNLSRNHDLTLSSYAGSKIPWLVGIVRHLHVTPRASCRSPSSGTRADRRKRRRRAIVTDRAKQGFYLEQAGGGTASHASKFERCGIARTPTRSCTRGASAQRPVAGAVDAPVGRQFWLARHCWKRRGCRSLPSYRGDHRQAIFDPLINRSDQLQDPEGACFGSAMPSGTPDDGVAGHAIRTSSKAIEDAGAT